MTDTEIKKALECCRNTTAQDCGKCPLYEFDNCISELAKNTLDLINRLEAEADNYHNIAKNQQNVSMERYFKIKELKQNLEEAHIDIKEHQAEIERLKAVIKSKGKDFRYMFYNWRR